MNPVPDNILSRRGGSRTARPPNPTVIPTHHSVVPAQSLPPPNTGAGTHPPFPLSCHPIALPRSPHMSFRAQRSGAEESRCPSPRCPRACGDPSLPLVPLSVVPAKSLPPKNGGGNPSTSSPVVLADAGTHPSFPRCHYYENRPFRGYKSLPP